MREDVVAAIVSTLSAAPPDGLGVVRVERRGIFAQAVKVRDDGSLEIPPSFTPPFAVIDDEPAEEARPNGRAYGALVVDVEEDGGETRRVRRRYRKTHDVLWRPKILICAANPTAAQALCEVFSARLPSVLTVAATGVDDAAIRFAAQLDVDRIGAANLRAFQHDYMFRDVRIRARYGRYATRDVPFQPVAVVSGGEED